MKRLNILGGKQMIKSKLNTLPPIFELVLIELSDNRFTTGHWTGTDWYGFAPFDQTAIFYKIHHLAIVGWRNIYLPLSQEKG